jgi:hypothetical protein
MEAMAATNEGALAAVESVQDEEVTSQEHPTTTAFGDHIDAIAIDIRRRAMDDGIAPGDSDAWNAVGDRIRSHAWRILFIKLGESRIGSRLARKLLRLARTRLLPGMSGGGFNRLSGASVDRAS